ncbi:MAG: hypothetical protein ACO3EE_05415 [Flavobacteriales bacterium]
MKIIYTLFTIFCSLSLFAQQNKIKTEEQTFFDEKKKITSYKTIEYDISGNIISVKYFNAENKLESSSIYEFNSTNILIKETNYDGEGKVEDVWNHYIDENGQDTLIKYGFPKRNDYFEKYKNTYNNEKKNDKTRTL